MTTLSSLLLPSNVLTADSTSTLKNKTIDGNENTLLNLPDIPTFALIRTPSITSPADSAAGVSVSPTIEGTVYAPLYSVDTRDYRQLQIDVAAGDFSSPVVDQQEDANNITVSSPLDASTAYKARIRDVAETGTESAWSAVVSFTTA